MKYLFRSPAFRALAAAVDALGAPLGLLWRRSGAIRGDRFLVIRLDHLGDVLPATGVPAILKRNRPSAHVAFLCSSLAAPLLEKNPHIDEVLVYDAPWFRKKRFDRAADSPNFRKIAGEIRRRRFDAGFSLRGDARELFLLWAAGVRERIGTGATGLGFLATRAVEYSERTHESQRTLALLRAAGFPADRLKPEITFSEDEERALDRRLAEWGLSAGDRMVGFHWEAGTSAKTWPRENVNAFFTEFQQAFAGAKLVLLGGPSQERGPKRAIDLRGKTSVRELALTAKRLSAFVGVDSGPAHLAAALGVPTVFLYSGTNSFEEWRPLSEPATVLRREVPCSPCALSVCNVEGHPCLSGIDAVQVIRAVAGKLRQ